MNRRSAGGVVLGLLVSSAVLGACASPAPSPGEPGALASGSPPMPPESSSVDMVSGEFVISNTTRGGAPVWLETVEVSLETSRGAETSWFVLDVGCTTDPAAPVSFDERLVLAYTCELPASAVAQDARLRAVVEATIAGSDEVFRLESELAR